MGNSDVDGEREHIWIWEDHLEANLGIPLPLSSLAIMSAQHSRIPPGISMILSQNNSSPDVVDFSGSYRPSRNKEEPTYGREV